MRETEEKIYGYTRDEYRRFRRSAWCYLVFFALLYSSAYCVRHNLSNAGELLIQQFGITKAQVGILTSTLFWTYGIGQLINGRLSDRFGPEKFIVLCVAGSIVVNLLVSLQNSFAGMVALWGVNGYIQSMAWAPGVALLTRWWPHKERGFATGFLFAFTGFGQAASILSVSLAMRFVGVMGWRAVFVLPAAFPLAALVLYLIFARTSPHLVGLKPFEEEDGAARSQEEEMILIVQTRGTLYPYRYVLSDPHFFTWIGIIFLIGIIRHGLSTWAPVYFVERYGVNINNGLLSSLALPVGMGVGTIAVPWLTDRFCPQNRLRAVVVSALAAPFTVLPLIALDPRIAWQHVLIEVLLFLAGFCVHAISGTSNTYATDVGGRVFSGTASGILSFAAYVGAAIQSLLYGFLLDTLGWNLIFLSVAAFCVVNGIFSIYDLRRHGEASAAGESVR